MDEDSSRQHNPCLTSWRRHNCEWRGSRTYPGSSFFSRVCILEYITREDQVLSVFGCFSLAIVPIYRHWFRVKMDGLSWGGIEMVPLIHSPELGWRTGLSVTLKLAQPRHLVANSQPQR